MSRFSYGFSLIEIMVATFLMGIMGLLLMTSLNTSVRAKENIENISERFQEVRQAMSRMSKEISMAYLSKHIYEPEPAFITQFKGFKDRIYFSAFGHSVHQKDAKESDQQVIGFYIATDKEGRQSLMRRMRANLNLDVEGPMRSQVLCPNVIKLEFSYYDNKSEKWEESWIADPSYVGPQVSQQKEGAESLAKPWRLPSFIKITMSVDMGNGEEVKWVSQTEIVVQEPLDLLD
jgi:general secretion pathway protein J